MLMSTESGPEVGSVISNLQFADVASSVFLSVIAETIALESIDATFNSLHYFRQHTRLGTA